jgi:uncharacterized protein YoxC
MDTFVLIAEVGFPIAAAIVAGYFVYLTLKFILGTVLENVQDIDKIIKNLDKRVDCMNQDVQKIDVKVSNMLGLRSSNDKRKE